MQMQQEKNCRELKHVTDAANVSLLSKLPEGKRRRSFRKMQLHWHPDKRTAPASCG